MAFPKNNQNGGGGGGRGQALMPMPSTTFYYTSPGPCLNPVFVVDSSLGYTRIVRVPVSPVPVQLINVIPLTGLSGDTTQGVSLGPPVPMPMLPVQPTPTSPPPRPSGPEPIPGSGAMQEENPGPVAIIPAKTLKIREPLPVPPPPPVVEEDLLEEISIRMGSGPAYGDLGEPPRPVSMMRFADSSLDPENWLRCKMIRDIKTKRSNLGKANRTGTGGGGHSSAMGTVMSMEPKTGPGSTYGAQERQELKELKRLRKYKTKPIQRETQPWLMKLSRTSGIAGEMKSKCFKGTKEGGISEHASYFILIEQKTEENVLEAYPVDNWFDFRLINSYRNLTAEEAEEKFRKRNETFNYFSLMTKKRLNKGMGAGSSDEESTFQAGGGGGKRSKLGTGSSTENGGGSHLAPDWTDSSDDDGDKDGGRSKKKRARNGCLISSSYDEEDNDRDVEYMSSSDCASSSDSDIGEGEGGMKENSVELLNSTQSELEEGSQSQSQESV